MAAFYLNFLLDFPVCIQFYKNVYNILDGISLEVLNENGSSKGDPS